MNRRSPATPAAHSKANKRHAAAPDPDSHRPKNYSRWRAATLTAVYVLFIAHIVHWKLAGKTLAPLELNEVMYTLELGIVTAGFIFMAVVVVATTFVGRFFCSWGCHILALEDLAAWLLEKIGIHPKPIRSRVLKWVPLLAMLYMFVWPQIQRIAAGEAMPAMHLRTDSQGWASFLTNNFWRNLPGPGVTILTFLICGFVMVYFLGSRGFCTYACPYGAVFRIADRFALGRIVARGDCSQCGKCTAACQSHVLVHRELVAYGRVVDPSCLKDLDCVAACPDGRVAFGVGKPAILTIGATQRIARPPYDFSVAEDVLMAVVFVAALFTFRGLYGTLPFLLTLALGGILAYSSVLLLRLAHRPRVRLNNFHLIVQNRLTPAGRTFAVLGFIVLLFAVHSAFIRYHEFQANRLFDSLSNGGASVDAAVRRATTEEGIRHFEFCDRWGLVRPYEDRRRLAQLHANLGQAFADGGDLSAAAAHLGRSTEVFPFDAPTHYNLGVILSALDRKSGAIREYRRAIELAPADAESHNNLGFLLAQTDDLRSAEDHLLQAIKSKPDFAAPHFNLGRIYQTLGRWDDARRSLETAARLDPAYRPYVAELLGFRPPDGTTRR